MAIDSNILRAFTPSGVLRASINTGNPILAKVDAQSGKPTGVSVDLAIAFGQKLGTTVELVVFDSAGKSVDAVTNEQADFGFFAIDPVRGAHIAFTAPYVLIEGFYLVHQDSPIRENKDVDTSANHVTVGKGSAYDLFLTRTLKHAKIVRAPTSPSVVQTFLDEKLEVAAGVKQQLEKDAKGHSDLRLLSERFMVIQQAMGVPKRYGDTASAFLSAFVEEMKATGFVARSLAKHQIQGASVAPLK